MCFGTFLQQENLIIIIEKDGIMQLIFKIWFFTISITLLLVLGACGGEESSEAVENTTPTDNSKPPSIVEEIHHYTGGEDINVSRSGGRFVVQGVTIEIPSGATDAGQEVSILKVEGEDGLNTYRFSGLRGLQSKTVQLTLPLPTTNVASKITARYMIDKGCYSKSLGGMIDCDFFLDAEVHGDKVLVSLPILNNVLRAPPRKSDSRWQIDDDVYSSWGETVDQQSIRLEFFQYEYTSEHFTIHANDVVQTSNEMIDKIDNVIAPALEYAYTVLGNLDFDLSRLPTHLHIYLKAPISGQGDLGGAVIPPLVDPYIEINELGLEDKKRLWGTLGHEFFHVVQSRIDPGYMGNDLLNEAASVWFEDKACNDQVWKDSSYISSVAMLSSSFQPYGLSQIVGTNMDIFSVNSDITSNTQVGYGVSIFLEFLSKRHGDGIVASIYNTLRSGSSLSADGNIEAMDAVLHTLGTTLKDEWNEFLAWDFIQAEYVEQRIANAYLADYSYVLRVQTNIEEYEKSFDMGPYSGVGIWMTGISGISDKPNRSTVIISLNDVDIEGLYHYQDGSFGAFYRNVSGMSQAIMISKNGINRSAVMILSNPTNSLKSVDLKVKVLSGNSCPSSNPYPDSNLVGQSTLYYRTSDIGYLSCSYSQDSGRLLRASPYLKNKKEGVHISYNLDGSFSNYSTYSNDLLDGMSKTYDNNGGLNSCWIYSSGVYVRECDEDEK